MSLSKRLRELTNGTFESKLALIRAKLSGNYNPVAHELERIKQHCAELDCKSVRPALAKEPTTEEQEIVERICWHESAHAVVAWCFLSKILLVSVEGGSHCRSYLHHRPADPRLCLPIILAGDAGVHLAHKEQLRFKRAKPRSKQTNWAATYDGMPDFDVKALDKAPSKNELESAAEDSISARLLTRSLGVSDKDHIELAAAAREWSTDILFKRRNAFQVLAGELYHRKRLDGEQVDHVMFCY